ncbi:hypothetical protein [Mailhella sp.]|uniref:hypothetical protein n=1 Tax=Mailhella sp. TaxID=1981029 RepID=UPI00406342D9
MRRRAAPKLAFQAEKYQPHRAENALRDVRVKQDVFILTSILFLFRYSLFQSSSPI